MSQSRNALVVDDQPVNRLLASRMLDKLGWTVAQAESGPAALDWLALNRVDLIMLDISMPMMSGKEVCQRVRAEIGLGGSGIRIVAYTAHGQPEERAEFLSIGFDAVLVKPISRDSVEKVLSALALPTAAPATGAGVA